MADDLMATAGEVTDLLEPVSAQPAGQNTNEISLSGGDPGVQPAASAPANPYEQTVIDLDRSTGQRSKTNLLATQGTSPEVTARALAVSKRVGAPVDVVERNLADFEAIERVNEYDAIVQGSPMLRRWLTEPVNARLAGSDLPKMAGTEGLWRGLMDTLARAPAEGFVGTFGSTLSGLGETYAVMTRTTQRALDAVGIKSPTAGMPLPWFLDPTEILKRPGETIKGYARDIGVPAERETMADKVVGGVGQIGAQILQLVATGGTGGLLTLFGQGVDQMADDVQKSGKAGTVAGDLTLVSGGAVTAIAEKMGLDLLLNRVPPAIKNKFVRVVSDIALAGGIEAAEEAVEAMGQNLLANYYLNANKALLDGVVDQSIPAGGSAMIVRGLLLSLGARRGARSQKQASPAEEDAQALDRLYASVRETVVGQKAPDKMAEFLASSGQQGNVYVPAEAVRTYLQGLDPDEAQRQVRAIGIEGQLAEALATGGDVVIPLNEYVAHAPEDMAAAWRDDLRLRAAGMSVNESKSLENSGAAEALGEQVSARLDAATRENRARGAVVAQVERQLQDAGESPEVSRQIAQLYGERYATRAARLGQGDAVTAYQASGVAFRSDLPEAVKYAPADDLELLIRAVRGKTDRSEAKGEGPTLLQTIARNGGIIDDAGELQARDVDKWHLGKAFQRKAIREVPQPAGGGLPGLSEGDGDRSRYGMDAWALRLWEEGYFPEHQERPSIDDLLAAIDEEMRGQPRRLAPKAGKEWVADFDLAVRDFDELLTRAGIDARKASDADIRAALDEMNRSDGETYEQAFRPKSSIEYTRRLDALKAGTLDRYASLLDAPTPPALRAAGLPALPLAYGQREARKTLLEKHAGLIDEETLRRLPDLIADPVMVIRQENGRFGVLLDKDVLVVIDPAGAFNRKPANVIVTVHPKDSPFALLKAVEEGRVVYRHEKRSLAWLGQAQRQLPGVRASRGFADNIVTEAALGKTYGQAARGNISFSQDPAGAMRSLITLFQDRDLSTVLHETGHLWLEELHADAGRADAPQQLKDDLATARKYLGAEGDAALTVEQHELWARTVEAYMMEGRSPSVALSPVLARFKAWMVSIYRAMLKLNAPINDDVRAVLDRMIATDDAIMEARSEMAARELFTSPEQAGMTAAEFKAYREAVDRSKERAERQVLGELMNQLRRRRTAEWKAEADEIRAEVRPMIDSQPDMRALAYLRSGALPDSLAHLRGLPRLKLSRDALIAEYANPEIVNALPRAVPPLVTDEGGVSPGEIAELLGFSDGRGMIDALTALAKEQAALKASGDTRSVRVKRIDEEVDRVMRERHGDMLTDGSIEAEALSALHNEARSEMLAAEVRQLARTSGREVTPYQLARDWARQSIAEKPVSAVSDLSQYTRAESRAGRLAEQALIRGDHDEALRRKQEQMIAHALWMEARDAKEEIEKARRMMDRLAGTRTSKSMDQEYLEKIHDLLERFDLKARSLRAVEKSESLRQWADAQAAAGVDVAVPDKLLEEAYRTSYRRMSIEEFRGLADSVKQLAHLGRLKRELIDGNKKREFEAVVEEAVTTAGAGPQRGVSGDDTGLSPLAEKIGKLASGIRSGDASLLKMETLFEWLDGDKTGRGVFTRLAFRPIADAQGRERDRLKGLTAKLAAIYAKVPDEQRARWLEVHSLPGLPKPGGRPGQWNKAQIIAMALNVGNESNLEKLLKGYKWADADLRAVLNRHLTREEWQFVQDVWDLIETQWPDLAAVHRRVNGVEPPKIERTPVETPFGTLPGGYYQIRYDANLSIQADKIGAKQDLSASVGQIFPSGMTRPSTRAGATHERVEFDAPIRLSLDLIPQQITDAAHDIEFREAVLNAHKFLSDNRVKQAIWDAVGPEYERMIAPWLQNVAHEWQIDRQGLNAVQKFASVLRTNVTIVGLGFRITTMLAQAAGYSNSIQRLGVAGMADGFRTYSRAPFEQAAWVREKSAEMRHRANDLERDMRAAQLKLQGKTGALNDVRRLAFQGIAMFDAAVSIPTWLGAYNKGLREGMADQDAVYYADKMVRDTQGAGAAKDMASVQRGDPIWKLFTMFYSYFSVFYNRQRGLARDVRDPNVSWGSVVNQSFFLLVVPTLASALLTGQGPEDDESWEAWATRNMVFGLFTGMPWVRDAANAASNKIGGKNFGGAKLSPVQGSIDNLIRLGEDIGRVASGEDASKNAIKNFFNVTGVLTALPLGQVGQSAQFVWDALIAGSQDPEGVVDWLKGLAFGPEKKK